MFGVLDRFEGDLAVILIEAIKDELVIEKKDLPEASEVGTIFNMHVDGNTYTIDSINVEETKARKEKTSQLLNSLQKKKKKSKFKREG